MKLSIKGINTINGTINPLVSIIESFEENKILFYMGLRVEIDPIVDYQFQNILIRWTDIDEGFNDKIIINNLEEFNSLFLLHAKD